MLPITSVYYAQQNIFSSQNIISFVLSDELTHLRAFWNHEDDGYANLIKAEPWSDN